MNAPLRLASGTLLLAAACALFGLPEAESFSVTGESLALNQRDFRIFDNFLQASLHENTAVHPNWPGYTEVELALWKAGAEWGSLPFGDGSGDPTQAGVGDGGANFDYFWNGNAAGIGGTNDNIVSAIPGPSGGVTAFTEFPASDGWRTRVYEDTVVWDDGPGAPLPGRLDFQGLMTHELGHVLGLGHSSASGATMMPAISGDASAARSIESDDQAGAQFVYGAANDLKPRIDGISGSMTPGGSIVITGAHFAANNNLVLLNSGVFDDGGAGGEAAFVGGLPASAGGTQISLTLPASGAESGGLHVKVPGASGASLSEGHPILLDGGSSGPVNSVQLFGPATATVGASVEFTFVDAPALSPYTLYYSKKLQGSAVNGQAFDIGPGLKVAATGMTGTTGAGSWTSAPLPPKAGGRTFYLELRVDAGGTSFDSNYQRLEVF